MAVEGLRRLGLLPLAQGRSVKREVWELRKGLISPFQQTGNSLELGTPLCIGPLRVPNNVEKEACALAEEVKNLLDARGDKEITVGAFPGQPRPPKPGMTFSTALATELRRLKVTVVPKSKLTIRGSFRMKPVVLEASVVAEDGREVVLIERH